MEFKPNQVINGSWGKVYMNGRDIAELESFSMKMSYQTKEVKMYGGAVGSKNTGVKVEAILKLKKVFSTELELLKDVQKGKLNTYCDLNVQLDDPDGALGSEAIAVKEALFIGDVDILSFTKDELLEREFKLSILKDNIDELESIDYI